MTWFHNSAAISNCEHENGEVSNTDKTHIYCRDRVNCFNFISYAVNISPLIAHYYKHYQISDFTVHSSFGIQKNQNKVEVISLCLIVKHLLVFKQLTDIYIKTFQQIIDKLKFTVGLPVWSIPPSQHALRQQLLLVLCASSHLHTLLRASAEPWSPPLCRLCHLFPSRDTFCQETVF